MMSVFSWIWWCVVPGPQMHRDKELRSFTWASYWPSQRCNCQTVILLEPLSSCIESVRWFKVEDSCRILFKGKPLFIPQLLWSIFFLKNGHWKVQGTEYLSRLVGDHEGYFTKGLLHCTSCKVSLSCPLLSSINDELLQSPVPSVKSHFATKSSLFVSKVPSSQGKIMRRSLCIFSLCLCYRWNHAAPRPLKCHQLQKNGKVWPQKPIDQSWCSKRLSFLNVCEDSSRPVLAGIDKGRHRSLPVRPSYAGTTDLFSASEWLPPGGWWLVALPNLPMDRTLILQNKQQWHCLAWPPNIPTQLKKIEVYTEW